MQVNSYNKYNKNQLSFGTKRISSTFVRHAYRDKPITAWFSRLSRFDKTDIALMDQLRDYWGYTIGDQYTTVIRDNFQIGLPTYALEHDSKDVIPDRILCLASVNNIRGNFHLRYLQASPERYRGSGSSLVGGLVAVARKLGFPMFVVGHTQSSKGFYDNLGMVEREIEGGKCMTFNRKEMAEFLQRQKAKQAV